MPTGPTLARLAAGDLVPHFTVADGAGRPVSYAASIWQRRHLFLVTVPASDRSAAEAALARFDPRRLGLDESDVAVVVTADSIAGVPCPGFLVADRWGEIAVVADVTTPDGLPDDADVRSWMSYVERQCPECQGEVR